MLKEEIDSVLSELAKDIKYIFVGDLPDVSTAMRNCIYLAVVEDKIREMHGYVVLNGMWADLGVFDSSDFEHEPKKETQTNCKNCGAPLKNGKCEYCGTED